MFFPNKYYSGLQKLFIELGIQEEKEIRVPDLEKITIKRGGIIITNIGT